MRSQKAFLLFVVLFFGIVVWMRVAPNVLAAAPGHDDFDNARFISPLTYFDIADTSEATTADDDPFDGPRDNSVWYSFTPDRRMPLESNTFGSSYDTFLGVYTGERGNLSQVTNNNDYFGPESRVHFIGSEGTQYHIMVSSCCGGSSGGQLNFLTKELTAPPNDHFADAAVIPSVPYPDTPLAGRSDAFAATLEANEPTPFCSASGTINNSVWYAYTPPVDRTISIALNDHPESQVLAVYTGSTLETLTQVDCRMFWGGDSGLLTLAVTAGTTYNFQAGNPFELGEYFWLSVQEPPPPFVNIEYYPPDPSTYDVVNFYGWAYDPANAGIETWRWDFGDGTTAITTDYYVTHRYTANGDYTVTLTVMTFDGREATTSRPLSVRTNDVSITKFTTPKKGRLGQTVQIVVGVTNNLTPQRVRVEFLSSSPVGFQTVGTLVLFVPVSKKKTTDFYFSYTFTPEDAAIGKVNFKAIAYVDPRDALPGDNEAISFPVNVTSGSGKGGATVDEADEGEIQEGFVLRSQQSEYPEMQDLFSLPSYWIYLPSIDTTLQD